MLSKIKITIDFNGPEAKLYHSNTPKTSDFKLHLVIPIIIVDNLYYNLFHSVKLVQQP